MDEGMKRWRERVRIIGLSLLIKKMAEKEKKNKRNRRKTNLNVKVGENVECRARLALNIKSLAIETHIMRVSNDKAVKGESGLGDETKSVVAWASDSTSEDNFSIWVGDEDVIGCERCVGVNSCGRALESGSSEGDGLSTDGEGESACSWIATSGTSKAGRKVVQSRGFVHRIKVEGLGVGSGTHGPHRSTTAVVEGNERVG